MTQKDYCAAIAQHYEQEWSTPMAEVPFTRGPIDELPRDFGILVSPPHHRRTMWTYATKCLSQRDDTVALELHMFSAHRDDDTLAELLVACSHYHRTGRGLDLGHTVNFGRPWIEGARCDHGLISLPYLDGPSLEWLDLNGKKVRFLWVIPITMSEAVFARDNGVDRLEERLEAAQINYLSPQRPHVA
jgi:hypothetical protein